MSTRVERIRAALETALQPTHLEIVDDSHLHAGHAGAAGGAGHFRVRIVSAAFAGRPPLQRHRMVYTALAALMPSEIHALSISAETPEG
jgi:BolA family transcriptional regulator, general stress-responsive regulator